MGLRVNTNVASLNAQRNLTLSTSKLNRSLERLSSGLRINRASDDAAGLAISERFRAEIRSLAQAERNANDGVSLLQIAEGALNETSGILIRLRELAVQAANGTLGDSERAALNEEFQAQIAEIDRIAAVTEFNGTQILNTTSTSITFQARSSCTGGKSKVVRRLPVSVLPSRENLPLSRPPASGLHTSRPSPSLCIMGTSSRSRSRPATV